MKKSAKRNQEENYHPQFVPQAFKIIKGQAGKPSTHADQQQAGASNGRETKVDGMTLVQLPASDLKRTVAFYTDVLGLALEYPERLLEINTFLQTMPRIGPGLHILETPASEFRHLHGTVNGQPEEYVAFYAKSLELLYGRLLDAGSQVLKAPSGGYMSFFDPEGNLIGVYERTDPEINHRFQTNITGFRHVQMQVGDPDLAAAFFESALGFQRIRPDKTESARYMSAISDYKNQPLIRLVQADKKALQPMHWILDGRPKHALELHSKNIGGLRDRVLEYGGAVKEELEFSGCGGYLKFYTPDGHYIWVNQDRSYCDY
jgi:predicted enzyme related to lactoylglutathione lyase